MKAALRPGLALALGLGAGMPAGAEGGPSAEAIARFEQAVTVAGCVVDELNQKAVLAEAEMDETEAGVIASWLVQEEKAVLEDNRLRLTVGACHG